MRHADGRRGGVEVGDARPGAAERNRRRIVRIAREPDAREGSLSAQVHERATTRDDLPRAAAAMLLGEWPHLRCEIAAGVAGELPQRRQGRLVDRDVGSRARRTRCVRRRECPLVQERRIVLAVEDELERRGRSRTGSTGADDHHCRDRDHESRTHAPMMRNSGSRIHTTFVVCSGDDTARRVGLPQVARGPVCGRRSRGSGGVPGARVGRHSGARPVRRREFPRTELASRNVMVYTGEPIGPMTPEIRAAHRRLKHQDPLGRPRPPER